jgi:hypothetical protein
MQTKKLFKCPLSLFITLILFLFNTEIFAQQNDKFSDESDVYSFELPAGVFSKKAENFFNSKILSATIKFKSEIDYAGDEEFNADLEKQLKLAKKGIKVKYQTIKGDKFTISGFDANGNIVYIKGNSLSMVVRNNPDNQEELNWLWTKTMIVTFTYPVKSKVAMDKILTLFLKSYELNVGLL